jgi:hypothetical protein
MLPTRSHNTTSLPSYIIPGKIKARQFLDRYELDNTRSSWRDLPKGVYVRHDIVSAFLLFLRCDLELFGGEVLINQHGYRRYIE